jgi:Flp pilus assembly pilin Flp
VKRSASRQFEKIQLGFVSVAVGEWGRRPRKYSPEVECHVKNLLKRLMQEEAGQDVIEYGLLAAGISVMAIPFVPTIGTWVSDKWNEVDTKLV